MRQMTYLMGGVEEVINILKEKYYIPKNQYKTEQNNMFMYGKYTLGGNKALFIAASEDTSTCYNYLHTFHLYLTLQCFV